MGVVRSGKRVERGCEPTMSDPGRRTLGRYEGLERVASGGMAIVYKAYDPALDREVAIKVLAPTLATDSQFVSRFEREANVVVQLRHPRIVPVFDFVSTEDLTYLVMEYVPGTTLEERLTHGPLMAEESQSVIDQLCEALEYAHRRGVIHRDIKPSNVLFDRDGNVSLSDFGLAHIVDGTHNLTGSRIIGTPIYMSPEQARGDSADGRCDQYSLGILLYLLSTGRLPFNDVSPAEALVKQMIEGIPRPRSINSDVPELVERVILKATAMSPEDRFESIAEFRRNYQGAIAHLNDKTTPPPKIRVPSVGLESLRGELTRLRNTLSIKSMVVLASIGLLFSLVSVSCGGLLAFLALGSGASGRVEDSQITATEVAVRQEMGVESHLPTPQTDLGRIPLVGPSSDQSRELPTITDDFEVDTGTLEIGEGVELRDGGLILGPFGACADVLSASDEPVGCSTVCLLCGQGLVNYQMETSFSYLEGRSDQSFGVILRLVDNDGDSLVDQEDYLLALGFEPYRNFWRVMIHNPSAARRWQLIKEGPAWLSPAGRANDVQVRASGQGRLMTVELNHSQLITLTADSPRPGEIFVEAWADKGAVGLIALGRGVAARFENFVLNGLP